MQRKVLKTITARLVHSLFYEMLKYTVDVRASSASHFCCFVISSFIQSKTSVTSSWSLWLNLAWKYNRSTAILKLIWYEYCLSCFKENQNQVNGYISLSLHIVSTNSKNCFMNFIIVKLFLFSPISINFSQLTINLQRRTVQDFGKMDKSKIC